jgi:hypothetical protein
MHRRFILRRQTDPTGVSGTGIVAEGVEFSDGRVALRWSVGEHRSTVIWDSIESVEVIHGHDGQTVPMWLDDATDVDALLRAAAGL